MAENYTTYTEVDPNSRVVVTSATQIDFTNLTREENAYVVYDYGALAFVGDFVIDVDFKANKRQIADAVEEIYKDKKVKVIKVNTINVKPKKRRVRGFLGMTSSFKKAIVSLRPGDSIEGGG